MNERLRQEIDLLPSSPGVYLMHNRRDEIIYVGKAKHLRNRVAQYFQRPQVGKVQRMVHEVDHFEIIQTETEKEALLLEINLIRQHYPRFNILLKDGKSYPYIAIYLKNDPYLKIMRHNKDKNYRYFGPFPNSGACYEIIHLLNRLFPLRKCKTLPSSPCLYYHLGQCLAPCIRSIPNEEYQPLIRDMEAFLEGKNTKKYHEIEHLMKQESANLNFEKAAEYKKILTSIDHVVAAQHVENTDRTDRDVFAISTRDGYLGLAVLLYRRGALLGKDFFVVEEFDDLDAQVSNLIGQYYTNHALPKEIIVSIPSIASLLASALECRVYTPLRGAKLKLVELALKNAKAGLDEHFLTARLEDDQMSLLEQLGTLLRLDHLPSRIELFDNSHIQGSNPVGAMVCFINGEKAKKMYRKYHIEHDETRDDFASMKEIVTRRYRRLIEESSSLPDLILVDGGLGQVHAAVEALAQLQITIPVAGLYKNDRHQTEGLLDKEGEIYPIATGSPLFFLLMRMQDEVHRFAIKFHRELRSKSMVASRFDQIPGLGEKRKRLLFQRYPTMADLERATLTELEQILPSEVASRVYEVAQSPFTHKK